MFEVQGWWPKGSGACSGIGRRRVGGPVRAALAKLAVLGRLQVLWRSGVQGRIGPGDSAARLGRGRLKRGEVSLVLESRRDRVLFELETGTDSAAERRAFWRIFNILKYQDWNQNDAIDCGL